jgi:transketolase
VEPPRATPSSTTTPTRSSPTATSSRAWPRRRRLAGHLGLGKLICLWDDNRITLDGPASLTMSEDVGARYAAMGWQVLRVEDGDTDVDAIDRAIAAAKADAARPSLICVRTTIGFGSPKKAGTSSAHGSPLGKDEVAATKRALGWDPEASFWCPTRSRPLRGDRARGAAARADWEQRFAAWRVAFPELAESYDLARARRAAGRLGRRPADLEGRRRGRDPRGVGQVHGPPGGAVPWLLGGDADLGGSTKTIVPGGDWSVAGGGRNLRFGIREHAMGAIVNGIAYHGGVRGFAATFFVFSDYMRPAVRLAALNHLPAIYVWTHDSIGVGEDGPDPPAGRAPDGAARDAQPVGDAAVRRQRDRAAWRRRWRAPTGRSRWCCRARTCRWWRRSTRRSSAAATCCATATARPRDPDRHRVRGAAGAGRPGG